MLLRQTRVLGHDRTFVCEDEHRGFMLLGALISTHERRDALDAFTDQVLVDCVLVPQRVLLLVVESQLHRHPLLPLLAARRREKGAAVYDADGTRPDRLGQYEAQAIRAGGRLNGRAFGGRKWSVRRAPSSLASAEDLGTGAVVDSILQLKMQLILLEVGAGARLGLKCQSSIRMGRTSFTTHLRAVLSTGWAKRLIVFGRIHVAVAMKGMIVFCRTGCRKCRKEWW